MSNEQRSCGSDRRTGPMYLLHFPMDRGRRSDLHGHEFGNKEMAVAWINQDLNRMAKKPGVIRVYERVQAKRRCSCCGEFHDKPGRALRMIEPTPPTDAERKAWEERIAKLRASL